MEHAFSVNNLQKRYDTFALGPLDLSLEPGRVLGFIGPNGSGKTTTLRCLAGLVRPDAGTVQCLGHDPQDADGAWKADLGFVSDEPAFYEKWTGQQNLDFLRGFYPAWSDKHAAELAERFACPLDKKAKEMSKGNRVKLALIGALAHAPRLLLLDEPTAGLDPIARAEVLDVLWELLEDGEHAIFYSTHNLGDVARLADELAFLREGRLIQKSPKDQITDTWGRISCRLEGPLEPPAGTVDYRQDGALHQLVSARRDDAIEHLKGAGATEIALTPLPIDEIAVFILKGADYVAAG